ncbi:MAG: DNA translocase FtsK 4TM domain-containing protein [Bacillota bacterium]
MARKNPNTPVKPNFKNEILGLGLISLGIIGFFSMYPFLTSRISEAIPLTGLVGNILDRIMTIIAGKGKFMLPFFLIWLGVALMRFGASYSVSQRSLGLFMVFVCITAFTHLQMGLLGFNDNMAAGRAGYGGGVIGALLLVVLQAAFGYLGSYIIIVTMGFISLILLTEKSLVASFKNLLIVIAKIYEWLRKELTNFLFTIEDDQKETNTSTKTQPLIINHADTANNNRGVSLSAEIPTVGLKESDHKAHNESGPYILERKKAIETSPKHSLDNMSITSSGTAKKTAAEYLLPPLTLLPNPVRLRNNRLNKDIAEKVKILEETLDSFGVKGKVAQVSLGPSVARFELQPAPGVKVSKIVSLADDIALSMAASDVRIEAPIPGKAAVGIEVPNKEISIVQFREVLETPEFHDAPSKLTVALGKDIAGQTILADLEKMPHLLIAGATGSGKSVCMNALICSLLFKSTPFELKFLMIDPKMVELTTYNGIPHLIAPVVTEPKKAATALRWVVNEMEHRYELFSKSGVRDIIRYNLLKAKEDPQRHEPALPYIVVLIDELADLMMIAPAEVEDAICRLAQMARAAGIHLVVATQRPSVDVITGVIKANIPSRIAFAVSSQIDSRTILDMGGAEKLLGRGDMLFFPVGASKPIRLQGVYVSDKEVEDIVVFLKAQAKPEYLTGISETEVELAPKKEDEDELLPEALRLTIESGQASISMLQRRLHIGYTRAARLMDIMEQKGLVGGYEGSKPRAVLAKWEDYQRLLSG